LKPKKEVNFMKVKRSIILLMAMVFILGVVGPSFSAQEIKGTVAKIDGNKLTIQDDMGKQVTISVQDPMTLRDLKVGDRVSVRDGKVTKEKT
jgi:outer membrane lipoprotein SlyB